MIETDCPFLSASELHITEQEREALIRAYHHLVNEQSEYITTDDFYGRIYEKDLKPFFNMAHWNLCGTVCCIGGTAEMLMRKQGNEDFKFNYTSRNGNSDSLGTLFYPPFKDSYNDISMIAATNALYNYLTTGDSNWNHAMKQVAMPAYRGTIIND